MQLPAWLMSLAVSLAWMATTVGVPFATGAAVTLTAAWFVKKRWAYIALGVLILAVLGLGAVLSV